MKQEEILLHLIYMLKQNQVFYIHHTIDDDLLVNISVEKVDERLTGFVRIRSKVKGIVVNLGDRLKAL